MRRTELRALARRPFDLATGPLLRLTLLRSSPNSHRLLLVIHHIVSDATSNHLLVDELLAAYAAFTEGRTPAAAPLPIQYADHASWQRRHLEGERAACELEWWRARLAGAPPLLELPADRPRPAEQRFEGAWVWRTVPAQLAERLGAFARRHGCTSFVLLLAAFKVLLHRLSGGLSGSEDIVVARRRAAGARGRGSGSSSTRCPAHRPLGRPVSPDCWARTRDGRRAGPPELPRKARRGDRPGTQPVARP